MSLLVLTALISFVVGNAVGIYLYLWRATQNSSLSDRDGYSVFDYFIDAIGILFSKYT